jgi:transcriptional regulator GlxA family with amidase domain
MRSFAIGKNANLSIILAMRIHVLALDGVFDLGLSAVLDAFQTANELNEMSGLAVPRFDVRIVGVRKAVKTSHGLNVPIQSSGTRAPGCVVVPAIGVKMPGPLEIALTRPDIRDAATALRQWAVAAQRWPARAWNDRDGRVRLARPGAATTW